MMIVSQAMNSIVANKTKWPISFFPVKVLERIKNEWNHLGVDGYSSAATWKGIRMKCEKISILQSRFCFNFTITIFPADFGFKRSPVQLCFWKCSITFGGTPGYTHGDVTGTATVSECRADNKSFTTIYNGLSYHLFSWKDGEDVKENEQQGTIPVQTRAALRITPALAVRQFSFISVFL